MSIKEKEKFFEEIYNEWAHALFNFLYYKCGDKTLAQDYTQEVFVKYWHKIDTIQAGKEKSYLFTTGKNLIINQLAHKEVVLKFKQSLKEQRISESPEFILEMKEFSSQLNKAISQLTDGEREVFLMNRIDGFKYREMAELLNVSQKAIEKRMHKALLKLRKLCKNI